MLRVYRCLKIITGQEEREFVLAPTLSNALNPVVGPLASFAFELDRVRASDLPSIDRVWALAPHAEKVAEAVHGMMSLARIMSESPKIRNDIGWAGTVILNRVSEALRCSCGEDWKPSPHVAGIIKLVQDSNLKKEPQK